jgi:hypothetical protein
MVPFGDYVAFDAYSQAISSFGPKQIFFAAFPANSWSSRVCMGESGRPIRLAGRACTSRQRFFDLLRFRCICTQPIQID